MQKPGLQGDSVCVAELVWEGGQPGMAVAGGVGGIGTALHGLGLSWGCQYDWHHQGGLPGGAGGMEAEIFRKASGGGRGLL